MLLLLIGGIINRQIPAGVGVVAIYGGSSIIEMAVAVVVAVVCWRAGRSWSSKGTAYGAVIVGIVIGWILLQQISATAKMANHR